MLCRTYQACHVLCVSTRLKKKLRSDRHAGFGIIFAARERVDIYCPSQAAQIARRPQPSWAQCVNLQQKLRLMEMKVLPRTFVASLRCRLTTPYRLRKRWLSTFSRRSTSDLKTVAGRPEVAPQPWRQRSGHRTWTSRLTLLSRLSCAFSSLCRRGHPASRLTAAALWRTWRCRTFKPASAWCCRLCWRSSCRGYVGVAVSSWCWGVRTWTRAFADT
mmetsp:Transcript_20160/g.32652  ORF Transcript_20160/g.32652 Transcript_20160/m.32652 type:complete len:217 (+) Transcript_20160:1067-1717(+)